MKSLNRTLSLTLVLVLVLGLVGVASASSFTDDASIQYNEAVDVMTGIGAINGMGDGTFAPKGNLTRAQAAKLVAYTVLGADIAEILPVKASTFKDVDVNAYAWAIPSIEYLVNEGVINGLGDGTFDPNGNVTGYQLAKMLLVALGIKGEFTGASWELNTAIAANKAGLLTGSKATSFTAAATREEAALYCFNAILYSPTATAGNQIWGIVDWDVSGANPLPIYGWVQVPTVTTGSIADSVYGLISDEGVDDFGRPDFRLWAYKNEVISLHQTVAPKLTYTTAVSGAKIFADLKLSRNVVAVTYEDTWVTNGTFNVFYNNTAATIGGNGALTEVYVDSATGGIIIVVVNTYVGTVTAVTAATAVSKASVTVTANAAAKIDNAFVSGEIEASGYKVNDVVLYTVAKTSLNPNFEVESVEAAEAETLTASSYIAGVSFVAGGATYQYSAKKAQTIADFAPHTVYFDGNGYVIDYTGANVPTNYAIVLAAGITEDGLGGQTFNVQLLKSDGTTEVVKGNVNYPAAQWVGKIVTTAVNATTGVYTLTDPASSDYSGEVISLRTGVSRFTWDGDPFYANANTLFLVRSGAGPFTYQAYTGVTSVPAISGNATGEVVVNNGIASVVYITNGVIEGTSAGAIYLTGTYTTVHISGGQYYVSNAIVDGVVKTLDLAAVPVQGLYTGITYNANNIGTIGAAATTAPDSPATGTVAAANGVVGLGNNPYYTYTADCAVYYVSTTGIGSVSSIAGLLTDANDIAIFTVNALGQVTSIYVQTVA
ncbi:MAG: S-layer homology domain-containing protein [Oscillospiraceae bacterium]|jgi:hypothetical protein|nr:S-layer homology domain-containing protein [Oscillospiraceae bacterium]